jgi:uncharacterized protein (TIGR00251 family)
MPTFKVERNAVSFWLRVKPRAARERLSVDAAGELRLELHAPPTDGLANKACIGFFARTLRLPQSAVVIASGGMARRKLLHVTGRSVKETIEQITSLASPTAVQRGLKLEEPNSARISSFDSQTSGSSEKRRTIEPSRTR